MLLWSVVKTTCPGAVGDLVSDLLGWVEITDEFGDKGHEQDDGVGEERVLMAGCDTVLIGLFTALEEGGRGTNGA